MRNKMDKELVITVVIIKRKIGEHKKVQQKLYDVLIFNEQELKEFIDNLYRVRNSLLECRT